MPPGSASASNTARPLSKGELDKYYSRIPDIKTTGSDRENVLNHVVANLATLLRQFESALSAQRPDDDKAWTAEMSQEFLTDVVGQVKAILGDKANKLTEAEKQPLLESLSKANQFKDSCTRKLEDVKKAPIKNASVNANAPETIEKDGKGKRRGVRFQIPQDSAPNDKVDPTKGLEKKTELDTKILKYDKDADPRKIKGCVERIKRNEPYGLY